ncbi:MAG: bifunctional folylpolyglutamate synthase/dihydrofolate synthase [Armatimonadetes bacterium]|nr:bifunctional folylpolyglutamate synthase/dihydrofolate synthase [Armatimonadota bacterium]
MIYEEAVSYLESLIDYERTPAGAAAARVWNLDRMRYMLEQFQNPHLSLRCLHIAGTKGKGSTAAMAASILTAAGCRIGLYTSPHLVSFRERIRIDGTMIPEADVVDLVEATMPAIESMRAGAVGMPSFFEAYTLLGILYLTQQQVDIAVMETGLGGRLDATNVVSPIACALTRIGRDHTQELGDTIAEIAREKAGIIKPGVSVVSGPQSPEVVEVFQEVCLERGAQLLVVGEPPAPRLLETRPDKAHQMMTIQGRERLYADLKCPLLGAHQAENAALAIGLVEIAEEHGIEVGEDAIRKGIASVRWPGRFQVVSKRPYIILDGAHDEVGAAALAKTIESVLPGRRVILVLGTGSDKDGDAIAAHLCPVADAVIATASSSPRALDAYELQRLVFRRCKHTSAYTPVSAAIRAAVDQARRNDVVVVTGSLYVVGEAMQALGVAD